MEKIQPNKFYKLDVVDGILVTLEPIDLQLREQRRIMIANHEYRTLNAGGSSPSTFNAGTKS